MLSKKNMFNQPLTEFLFLVETQFYLQSVYIYIYIFSKLSWGLGVMAWGMALVSTRSRNKCFCGVKRSRCIRLPTLPPSVSGLSRKCGNLDISQPYRPLRPATGIPLLSLSKSSLEVGIAGSSNEQDDPENACFRPQVGEREIPTLLGPLQRQLLRRFSLEYRTIHKVQDPVIKSVLI
jgi:hypothetical protein